MSRRGFTLIELLVVISIIAILSTVGFVSFQNVRERALDAKVKADLDSIKKAYETNYDPTLNGGQGGYKPLEDNMFASGKIPTTPGGESYFNVMDENGVGFKVCASLENNSDQYCNAPSATCYCKESTQGTIPSDTLPSGLVGTDGGIGLGPTTCMSSLSQGLIGFWKMDERSGNTVEDYSVNNQTLTLNSGGTWVDGKIGKALQRTSGTFGTILDADHLDGMQNLTISAWVNPTKLNNTDRGIFNKGAYNASPGVEGYYMAYRLMYQTEWVSGSTVHPNGHWQLDFKQGSNNSYFGPSSSPSDPKENKWRLITGVFDGVIGQARFYDMAYGEANPVTTRSVSGSINSNNADVQVGAGFEGIIDEIRIYNKALSPQEVQALYNGGNGCVPQ